MKVALQRVDGIFNEEVEENVSNVQPSLYPCNTIIRYPCTILKNLIILNMLKIIFMSYSRIRSFRKQ